MQSSAQEERLLVLGHLMREIAWPERAHLSLGAHVREIACPWRRAKKKIACPQAPRRLLVFRRCTSSAREEPTYPWASSSGEPAREVILGAPRWRREACGRDHLSSGAARKERSLGCASCAPKGLGAQEFLFGVLLGKRAREVACPWVQFNPIVMESSDYVCACQLSGMRNEEH
jgi:hypothetical protein